MVQFSNHFEILHFWGLIGKDCLKLVQFLQVNVFLRFWNFKNFFYPLSNGYFLTFVHEFDKLCLSLVLSKFSGILHSLNRNTFPHKMPCKIVNFPAFIALDSDLGGNINSFDGVFFSLSLEMMESRYGVKTIFLLKSFEEVLIVLFWFSKGLLFLDELLFECFVILLIEKEDIFEIVDLLFIFLHESFLPVLNEISDTVSPIDLLVFHRIDLSLKFILSVLFLIDLIQELLVFILDRLQSFVIFQSVLLEFSEPLLLILQIFVELFYFLL